MFRLDLPQGRLSWPALGLGLAAVFGVLCVVWALTHSRWLQAAAMIVLVIVWRLFPTRWVSRRPLPLHRRGRPPVSKTRKRIVLTCIVLVDLGVIVGLSVALGRLDLYPGPWAMFWLGFAAPFAILVTRFATQPPPDDLS